MAPALGLSLLLFLPLSLQTPPQTPQDHTTAALGETVVTATRSPAASFDAPFSTDVVTDDDVVRRAYRTTAQMLEDTPGIFVQKTSYGQGSPYIRGFTGFRNVFLIDGVRLNNSVFRSGPNQYWNTVDPYSIDRLEIVKGPSSVLYGSDAIGGTVQAFTKDPRGGAASGRVATTLFTRASTAEHSVLGRVELDATPRDGLGVLLGGTGKNYGDLEGGADTGRQPNTGYGEWDVDLKVVRELGDDRRLVFLYQGVNQNNVPRTHKTVFAVPFEGTSVGSDLRRDLDQERTLAYVQYLGEDFGLGLSWHEQKEERFRTKGSGSKDRQGFDVGTLGLFGHLTRPSSIGTWTAGFDYYRDDVSSFSTKNPIQGPVADDATYDLAGLYVQDEFQMSRATCLVAGARFSYASADANSVQDPTGPGAISVEEDWSELTGSLRFVHEATESVNVFGGISQGFRAPNLSDLTRFDTARTNEFEIASPGLDPEHSISYEIGFKKRTEETASTVSVFYTDIQDAIVRVPTGNTNGSGEFEVTKENVGDGYAFGIETGGAWRFRPEWTLFGNAAYIDGKADTFPTSAPVKEREYLDRLMPTNAQAGVSWEDEDGRWAEARLRWVGDGDRLSTRDRSDTSRIPPGGTPGYVLVDLAGGFALTKNTRLDVALRNLTDEDYRTHGSGQNGPGRNLVLSLTVRL
ncbi:MAG TPA: TonB-dependent receptor [Planctomycetes bacterium]|nr:TonB-dependent receptor [Planctomycetota bacterium]